MTIQMFWIFLLSKLMLAYMWAGLKEGPGWAKWLYPLVPEWARIKAGGFGFVPAAAGKCWVWGKLLSGLTAAPPGEYKIWAREWVSWADSAHLSDGLKLQVVNIRARSGGGPGCTGYGTCQHAFGLDSRVGCTELGRNAQWCIQELNGM